jgi:hypothetical protein
LQEAFGATRSQPELINYPPIQLRQRALVRRRVVLAGADVDKPMGLMTTALLGVIASDGD